MTGTYGINTSSHQAYSDINIHIRPLHNHFGISHINVITLCTKNAATFVGVTLICGITLAAGSSSSYCVYHGVLSWEITEFTSMPIELRACRVR